MTDFARGDRLLELRAERGMSREDVAHELGVTTKSLFTWEKKSGAIKSDNAKRIAEFYGVVDWQSLVTRDKQATGPSSRGQVGEGFEEFRGHVADLKSELDRIGTMLERVLEHMGIPVEDDGRAVTPGERFEQAIAGGQRDRPQAPGEPAETATGTRKRAASS